MFLLELLYQLTEKAQLFRGQGIGNILFEAGNTFIINDFS